MFIYSHFSELKSFHIVRAYGVMIESKHTYLVMEYMSNSDLLKYLRQQKTVLEIEVSSCFCLNFFYVREGNKKQWK